VWILWCSCSQISIINLRARESKDSGSSAAQLLRTQESRLNSQLVKYQKFVIYFSFIISFTCSDIQFFSFFHLDLVANLSIFLSSKFQMLMLNRWYSIWLFRSQGRPFSSTRLLPQSQVLIDFASYNNSGFTFLFLTLFIIFFCYN